MPPETEGTEGIEGTVQATVDAAAPDRSKMTRAEQDAADRDAFLSGAWEDDADEKPAPEVEKKPSAREDDEEAEDDVEESEASDEDDDLDLDDDEDEESDESEDDDDAPADKQDPELAKRLAKVQKYEKKIRDQAAERDKQFAHERDAFVAEWKPKIDAYENFEKLKARKSDPVSIFKAVGYNEDDYSELSKIFYALSKEGAADPKNREAVSRAIANRELREQNAALEARLAGLEGKLTKQEAEAQASREVEVYVARIAKAIGDDTPLVKKRLELAPKSTRNALDQVALKLSQKAGGFADPKKVVRAYEKKLERDREIVSKLSDAQATAPAKKKPVITVVDKTKKGAADVAPKKTTNGSHGPLIPTREEMIENLRKIDRGEIDPDAD